jgi:integrase
MKLDQLIDDWERWMMRRDRAAGTIKAYRWALDRLAQELHLDDVHDLTPRQLEAWQDRNRERGLSTGSRMLAITGCRSLLAYARKQRLGLNEYLPDALETITVHYKERREILRPDFERLVYYLTPRRPRMAIADLRTRALFFYLLYSAARVSEALQLTRVEVDRALVWQKGGSSKVLYVPSDAVQFVSDYLQARDDDCPWLWVTHGGGTEMHRLAADAVRDIWKRLAKRLGVPYFTTHQLRHSHATYAKRAGVDRDVTQAQLGHKDPRMMERYRHFDDDDRQDGVDQLQDYVRSIARATSPRPRLLPRLRRRAGGR